MYIIRSRRITPRGYGFKEAGIRVGNRNLVGKRSAYQVAMGANKINRRLRRQVGPTTYQENENMPDELSPDEMQAIEQEIARRETNIHNIIQAALDEKPAEVYAQFESELKHRLQDILDDEKIELTQAIFGSSEEPDDIEEDSDPDEVELTQEEVELFTVLSEMTDEEYQEFMNDPEFSDDDKEYVTQIREALTEDEGEI